MSREFKFRFWRKHTKVMERVEDSVVFLLDRSDKDTIPLQFTGLLDKNGKEIYEGDILRDLKGVGKVEYYAPHFIVIEHENPGESPTSKFWLGAGKAWKQNGQLHNTEIIGNIYENSTLIKQS